MNKRDNDQRIINKSDCSTKSPKPILLMMINTTIILIPLPPYRNIINNNNKIMIMIILKPFLIQRKLIQIIMFEIMISLMSIQTHRKNKK